VDFDDELLLNSGCHANREIDGTHGGLTQDSAGEEARALVAARTRDIHSPLFGNAQTLIGGHVMCIINALRRLRSRMGDVPLLSIFEMYVRTWTDTVGPKV